MTYHRSWDDSGQGRWRTGAEQSTTNVIIVTCSVVFLLSAILYRIFQRDLVGPLFELRLSNSWMMFPFVTYTFLHDLGGLLHLVMNMLLLWFIGGMVESELGRRRFLTLYFGSGMMGGVLYLADAFLLKSLSPVIGASGACLGLLIFAACRWPATPVIFYFIPMRLRTLAIIYVAFDLYPVLMGHGSQVAHWCHLGGAGFGYLYHRRPFDLLSRFTSLRRVLARWRQARHQETERTADAEMDRILRKVSESGMTSLSSAERRFLEDRSRHLRKGR